MTAVTAITVQNTTGVKTSTAIAPALLEAQLEAVFQDVTPDAVKIGLVPDKWTASVIAQVLKKYKAKNVVIDPIIIGGDERNTDYAKEIFAELLPLATIITPNIREAKALGIEGALKKCAVLIKGGHGNLDDKGQLTDTLYLPDGYKVDMKHFLVETNNTHGTGCSFSTAIAAYMAKGEVLTEAVIKASSAIHHAISSGAKYCFGNPEGRGPINHFAMNK